MQRNQYHRLLALLMTVVTIFQFVVISPDVVFAETEANTAVENALPEESNAASEESGKEETPVLQATKTASSGKTILAFTSDIHNTENDTLDYQC